MVALILGILAGLVIGLLIYRNNASRADKLIADTKATLEADKAKAKSILDALKNR